MRGNLKIQMIYLTDRRCCGIICHVWEGWRWRNPPSCSLCSVLLCYRYKSVAICGLTCMSCVFFSWMEKTANFFWLECCFLCIVLPLYLQPPAASWWNSSAFVWRYSKFASSVCLLSEQCRHIFFSFVMRTLRALPTLGWWFWEFVAISVGEIFMAASSSLWHRTWPWPEIIGSDGWMDRWMATLHESRK